METLNLKEAKKYLPHGGINLISERTQVLRGDVSRMFNGWEPAAAERVKKATREYLTEVNAGLTELLQQS